MFGFGVIYRYSCGLGKADALFSAIYVLGTMEFPGKEILKLQMECYPKLIASIQVFANMFLILVGLALFVGNLQLRERNQPRRDAV